MNSEYRLMRPLSLSSSRNSRQSSFSVRTIFVPRPRSSPVSSYTEKVESADDSHTHCFSSSFDFECTATESATRYTE